VQETTTRSVGPEQGPPPGATGEITQWLRAWKAGDARAFERLLAHVRGDLRGMAAARLRGQDTPSLAAADLVQEALLRVLPGAVTFQDSAHFFGTLALAMRQILVDHARARAAQKRGGPAGEGQGWRRVTWSLADPGEESPAVDLIHLDQLFGQLENLDPRAARICELTYFAGLERAAIAETLDLSLATVDRDLRFARAWLASHLSQDLPG